WVALALLVLIAALQLKLWTGTGGMPDVSRLRRQVESQRAEIDTLRERNEALAADVRDLKEGREAVEERARAELGMVKPGETFYQVIESPPAETPAESE
ncbi:MAG TPA: cell division protein FtsB, partial [Candidatus Saccharimonadia bacterium]|nr:cell division protein FtsB [Candidatus Saccharimonadia bacterium]